VLSLCRARTPGSAHRRLALRFTAFSSALRPPRSSVEAGFWSSFSRSPTSAPWCRPTHADSARPVAPFRACRTASRIGSFLPTRKVKTLRMRPAAAVADPACGRALAAASPGGSRRWDPGDRIGLAQRLAQTRGAGDERAASSSSSTITSSSTVSWASPSRRLGRARATRP